MIDILLQGAVAIVAAVLAFLVLFPAIIFWHEYGHFGAARLLGIKAQTFALGFGKARFSWTDRSGTEWRIGSIPIGGYVRFTGDDDVTSTTRQSRSRTDFRGRGDELDGVLTPEQKAGCFHFRPIWQRAFVIAAGPLANFALAIVLYALVFAIVGRVEAEPVVGGVVPGTAAEAAGFQAGDRIERVNGRPIESFAALAMRVQVSSGERLAFEVVRAGEVVQLSAAPRRTTREDVYGNEVRSGHLGIQPDLDHVLQRRLPPGEAMVEGVAEVGRVLSATGTVFRRLLTLEEDPRQLGGPVRIAQYAGQAARFGFQDADAGPWAALGRSLAAFVQMTALVSIAVGAFNLLPIPALDGGSLTFYAYEAIAGRPIPDVAVSIATKVGVIAILGVTLFTLCNDLTRIILAQL